VIEARLAPIREEALRRAQGAGPAHDALHILRVEANATRIARAEGADEGVTRASALLHELFSFPKGHPESHRSGERCAEEARRVLERAGGWSTSEVDAVAYAIAVHPFSLGVTPTALEAKVLQDADRLDAIGAIGLARLFATTTEMQRPFYDLEDPFCERRAPDDKAFGIDHIWKKLTKIPSVLHTSTARAIAAEHSAFVEAFVAQLRREVA